MKVMIDIPEETYNKMRRGEDLYPADANVAIFAIETGAPLEECEDCINRKSLKQKLQENHDFFVNAYGGFSNLPRNDKSRVDEITNCIAMMVNEPPVTPAEKVGHWIDHQEDRWIYAKCSECETIHDTRTNYCPNCGSRMTQEVEE